MVMVDWIFVVRSQQISCDKRNFVCRGEKCFVINELNNKTNTLLNVGEYLPILTNSSYGLVG